MFQSFKRKQSEKETLADTFNTFIYGGGGGDSPVLMVHVTASALTSNHSSKVRLLISLNVWFIVNYCLPVSPDPYLVLL